MSNHIVYAGYYEGTCVYVGEGKPDRYKHLTSGVSHVYEANYYHHTGKVVDVKVLMSELTKDEAILRESELITTLKPLWNKACYFGSASIVDRVESKIKEVFGKERLHWKSKAKQLNTLRQVAGLLDQNGVTRISSQQTQALIGCPRIINRFLDPNEWEESKLIFTTTKLRSGLWEVKLNES